MTNRAKIVLSILSVAVALWLSARSHIDGDSNTVDASPNPPSVAVVEAWKPPTVTRSITAYMARSFKCPMCDRLKPELDRLRNAGWEVTENYSEPSSVRAYPTIEAHRNGVKVFQHAGYLDAVEIGMGANADKLSEAKQSSSGFCSSCSRRRR